MGLLNRGRTGDVTTRLPLPVSDITKATEIVQVTNAVYTLQAGVAGTTGSLVIFPAPISAFHGDVVGRFGDSSLSVIAGALTTEIPYGQAIDQYNKARQTGNIQTGNEIPDVPYDLTSTLSNGQFYVVYETGRVYYKKATNAGTASFTYKYRGTVVTIPPVTTTPGPTQNLSGASTSEGTVTANTTAGGTQIAPLNTDRNYVEFRNRSASIDGYYGAMGAVDSTFMTIKAGQTKTWNSQEALGVLAASGTIDIEFVDYSN